MLNEENRREINSHEFILMSVIFLSLFIKYVPYNRDKFIFETITDK